MTAAKPELGGWFTAAKDEGCGSAGGGLVSYVAFIGLGGSGVDAAGICELGRGAEAGFVVGVEAAAAVRGGDLI